MTKMVLNGLTAALVLSVTGVFAEDAPQHVRVELVADVSVIGPGQPFRLGVRYVIEPHAHIYWRSPGSSGLPSGIRWTLPEGFEAGPLQWPAPRRFEMPEIEDISYGYEEEVLLFSIITPGPSLQRGSTVAILAEPYWLVCLDDGACIPGREKTSLNLPTGDRQPSKRQSLFERFSEELPRDPARVQNIIHVDPIGEGASRLHVTAREPWRFSRAQASPLRFFPYHGPAWNLDPVHDSKGKIVFVSLGKADPDDGPLGGVLSLILENKDSGVHRSLSVRVGPGKPAY